MDQELMRRIDAYVDEVWEDVVQDICTLVAHESVADAASAAPGAPFGPGVRAALDDALAIAKRLGLDTGEDEGFIGWADVPGASERQVATIAHLDVVPAGAGWSADPFQVRRHDGWLIGRGVADDKGPAVLSLYVGAFLKRMGELPRYTFRALLGCDEEVGMTDVKHYLSTHDDPAFLFTPDAEFPVCNAEKGLFEGVFVSAPIEGGVIRSWSGSDVSNAIPGSSVAELAVDAGALAAPRANADRIVVESLGEGSCRITATGVGGHASLPAGTVNAVGLMVGYLQENAGVLAPAERDFVDLMAVIHADTAGEALGVASANDTFGPLTLIGSVVKVEDGRILHAIDSRYPDSTTGEEMERALSQVAERYGASFELEMGKPPFSVEGSDPAVQALLATYNEVTGKDAQLFSMGGGTYARSFKRAVSFGPEDEEVNASAPDWVGPMHGADEGANEEALKRALKMYIIATLRLMELDL